MIPPRRIHPILKRCTKMTGGPDNMNQLRRTTILATAIDRNRILLTAIDHPTIANALSTYRASVQWELRDSQNLGSVRWIQIVALISLQMQTYLKSTSRRWPSS